MDFINKGKINVDRNSAFQKGMTIHLIEEERRRVML